MEDPFLSLVKLGIGKPVNSLPHLFDWSSIYALAAEQGLSAFVMDGIERLPDQFALLKRLRCNGLEKFCRVMSIDILIMKKLLVN